MRQLLRNTARDILVFMTDENDGKTGLAGLTLTITASKAAAAFASISPTVTDRGSGWYKLALTASHTDTLGDFALNITATGADDAPILMEVVSPTPVQVVIGRYTDDDADSPTITCKVGETGVAKSVTVTDSNGDAVDLTDWGDKQIVIERANSRTDVQLIANAAITISGASNQTFSFTPSSTVLAQPGDFKWSLREVSTQDVIIDGRLTVSYSPLEDEE